MKLTILGCGRYAPPPQVDGDNYNSAGNLISTESTRIVLDFGRGNLRTLTALGYSVHDIAALCITHFHPDHVADVLAFFQAQFVDYKKGLSQHQFQIIGPEGVTQWFNQMTDLMYEAIPYRPIIHEQPNEPITIGDLTITTADMHHMIPDIAYRVTQHQHSIVYTGDTGMNDQLVPFAHQADVLVAECSDESTAATTFHLNPKSCAAIATAAKVKHLVITHYGEASRRHSIQQETALYFHGILTVATEQFAIALE